MAAGRGPAGARRPGLSQKAEADAGAGPRRRRRRLGLHWSDIDFGNSTLTIRQALQRVGGRPALVEPKTSLSRRTVPVPRPRWAPCALTRQSRKLTSSRQVWPGKTAAWCSPRIRAGGWNRAT